MQNTICKPVIGVFKDVFGTGKAAFEEGLLNRRNECQRKKCYCV